MRTEPSSTSWNLGSRLTRVDLPLPERPTIAMFSPELTFSDSCWTAAPLPRRRAARWTPAGGPGGEPKDTLRNIRETRQFVINVVTYELAEAMNLTSGEYDKLAEVVEPGFLSAIEGNSDPAMLPRVHSFSG